MIRYQQKAIEAAAAFRWFKHGDHLNVERPTPEQVARSNCNCCGKPISEHGFMNEVMICPGDWVVVMAGYHVSVYSDNRFHQLFEEVSEPQTSRCLICGEKTSSVTSALDINYCAHCWNSGRVIELLEQSPDTSISDIHNRLNWLEQETWRLHGIGSPYRADMVNK